MAGVPRLPKRRTTASEVLRSFDNEFAEVAVGVAEGRYVFWLGSGLSRSVVPDVGSLLASLLSFLQERVDAGDDRCRFARALEKIFGIAGISAEARKAIDVTMAASHWPGYDDLVQRMIEKYSIVLDVAVGGEASDFLMWDAIDVPGTYGAESLAPAAEHLCLAILMIEGVIDVAPTTNWDGLVEAAVAWLVGDPDSLLRVVVDKNEFGDPPARSDLIKFHGCAVKAGDDPENYRHLLIGRDSQISGWTTELGNQVMKDRLEYLVATRPALVIGLSAQDANIHTILHQASKNLGRTWPVSPPAVVFAEEGLDHNQVRVLRIMYGKTYHNNQEEVEAAARLGVYAQPLLMALVLFTLADKVSSLVGSLTGRARTDADLVQLGQGVLSLRDLVASSEDDDVLGYTHRLVAGLALILSIFRRGVFPTATDPRYEPLTAQPIAAAKADPNVDTDGSLGELAVAASLLGRGVAEGIWTLEIGDAANPRKGSCNVVLVGGNRSQVFLVRDAAVLASLESQGHADMANPDTLVIHSTQIPQSTARSPRANYGRTRRRCGRQLAIETIDLNASDADDLFASFRNEAAL